MREKNLVHYCSPFIYHSSKFTISIVIVIFFCVGFVYWGMASFAQNLSLFLILQQQQYLCLFLAHKADSEKKTMIRSENNSYRQSNQEKKQRTHSKNKER